MRQLHRKGLATVMLTGGALALAGHAHADSTANGGAVGSPGVIAGNTIQLPIHVPVSVCGNTVNVVGLLNPAAGNTCANTSGGSAQTGTTAPGGQTSGNGQGVGSQNGPGGAVANGTVAGSPGVISGNGIQLPIDLPVNVSGNSLNVVGIGNPALGNTSVNGPSEPTGPKPPPVVEKPVTPPTKPVEKPITRTVEKPNKPVISVDTDQDDALAQTGADGIGYAVPVGAALMLGGAVLFHRARRTGA
ncbi:chaplin [Streptomyces sp. NPDC005963]|uniref:chaplin n=1 Tax=Streptomyces sp. NPDC005963 TaxID=3156721 RepID=UPI0033E3E23E